MPEDNEAQMKQYLVLLGEKVCEPEILDSAKEIYFQKHNFSQTCHLYIFPEKVV